MTDQPNDEKITWVQAFKASQERLTIWVTSSNYGIDDRFKKPEWRYPDYTHHLHVGSYQGQRQITVIVNGVDYGAGPIDDILGERVASGTPDEMFAMLVDYARML